MSLRVFPSLARARGWNVRVSLLLVVSLMVAVAAARVSINLRTPADRLIKSDILDSGILLGMCVPVAIIVRMTQDRAAWLSVTGCRSVARVRSVWALFLLCLGVGMSCLLAALVPGQQSRVLIAVDFQALLATGLLGAVVLGAELGWLLPTLVAMAASTPGLLPISTNILVRADRVRYVEVAAGGLGILAIALFIAFDDYGIAPSRRLVRRLPGVLDD